MCVPCYVTLELEERIAVLAAQNVIAQATVGLQARGMRHRWSQESKYLD